MVINDQNYQKHGFLTLKFCSVEREFVFTNAVIFQFQKQKKNVKVKPKTPSSVPDVFILIGVGDLKCVIEV